MSGVVGAGIGVFVGPLTVGAAVVGSDVGDRVFLTDPAVSVVFGVIVVVLSKFGLYTVAFVLCVVSATKSPVGSGVVGASVDGVSVVVVGSLVVGVSVVGD